MFENNGGGNGDEGIFFKFTWELSLSEGSNLFTVLNDDGFYLLLANGKSFDFPGKFAEPEIREVDLKVSRSGNYAVTLYYGALSDTSAHVMIVKTPNRVQCFSWGLALSV